MQAPDIRSGPPVGSAQRRGAGQLLRLLAILLAAVALFLGYFRIALTVTANADGAGNALQASDLLHGNLLLHGWTLSDVSFYGVELFQFAAVELITGLSPRVVPAGAALSYTLIVLAVLLLAAAGVTGRRAWLRAGLAASFVLLPQPGLGQSILLNGPDHIGAALPVLLAWLVLQRLTGDRLAGGRVRTLVLLAAILGWGQLADPLVTLLAALPLIVVSAWRAGHSGLRGRGWRTLDGGLLLAGAGSVFAARLAGWLLAQAGGFRTQAVPIGLGSPGELGQHLATARDSVALLFGCYFPDLHGWLQRSLGVLHLLGVGLVLLALGQVGRRAARGAGNRLDEVIALGVLLTVAAFVVSALNTGLLASHEIAPVLPLSAVLVARVLLAGRSQPARLAAAASGRVDRAVAALLVALLLVGVIDQLRKPPVQPAGTAVADWLQAHHLNYGLGGYWVSNTITVDSRNRMTVVPVNGHEHITGYRWESRRDWYDPSRHDARFLVLQLHSAGFPTVEQAIAQFGEPVSRTTLPTSASGQATVLVYDHNLLIGLPAWCGPGRDAASMAGCG